MDVNKLITLANYLDEIGLVAEADLIDGLINSTRNDSHVDEEDLRLEKVERTRDTSTNE